MKGADLDYAQAPRPTVVFGCMMLAPWLGTLAGLLLALGPADGLPDRFAPLALAAVHALALGMLLPVMIGALFQMMPVVARVPVAGSRFAAPFVALCGTTVAAGLAAGFLGISPNGFRWAAMVALFFALVAGLLLAAGCRVERIDATTRTLAGIGAPLLVTVVAGLALAGMLGGMWTLPLDKVLPLHVAWGLGGWLAALVSGVSAKVLPMFWQARRLPPVITRSMPWLHWLPLSAYSGALVAGSPAFQAEWVLLVWLALVVMLAASMLVAVLGARRRHDQHWLLWIVAIASMMLAALLTCLILLWPAHAPAATAWWIGVLALVGGGVLPITAMLGKIVPFLVWLHLRRLLPPRARVPVMQAIISPARQRQQAVLMLTAYGVLLALPVAPGPLARVGGILFALACAWLGMQLLGAMRCMLAMRRQGGLPPRLPEADVD